MDYSSKTIKSTLWVSFSQILTQVIQFIVSIILARLLFPKDFGIIAMITVFTNFLSVFQGLGLSSSIIQKRNLDDEHLSSIFWVVLCFGLLLTILMILLSPLISYFYNQSITKISICLGTTFFISSLGAIPNSLLQKEMKFKLISIINISSTIFSGILAIFLALLGFGVWSLVIRQITYTLLITLLSSIIVKWMPSFTFNWSKIKEMFNFGINLTGFNFVNYFSRNLDNLLIGKFLGPKELGYYNFSYNIMLYPLSNISGILSQVFFPAFSKIQDEISRLRYIYKKANFFISLLTFPLMIGLFVLAEQFIKVIFGIKWIDAVPIIKPLSLVGLVQSIGTTVGWIYLTRGRTDIMFKWGIFSATVVIFSFIIGIKCGIKGVATAYAIATYLILIPNFYIPFRLIDLNIFEFFKSLIPTILSSIIMGLILTMVKYLLPSNLNDHYSLVISIIVGIISYVLLVKLFKNDIYSELFSYIKKGFQRV